MMAMVRGDHELHVATFQGGEVLPNLPCSTHASLSLRLAWDY